MEIIRKSIKVTFIALALFIILTIISAAVIYFTDIKESWSYGLMLASLIISSIFAGVLEAKIFGKRVLFVFLITIILFVAIVYGSVHMIFSFK